jgi:hypothetical protein
VFLLQGNHSEATLLGEEAAKESRERGYTAGLARALNCLAWTSLLRGDPERASESYEQSLTLYKESGDQTIAAESLEGLACAAGARGQTTRSASLFGAAEAPGYQHTPAQRALREPYMEAARSATNKATWQAAFTEGRSTRFEDAISNALQESENRQA